MDSIEPKFIACLIDMSHCCEKDFLERCGGKLYLSGFYDDNTNTYICSAEKMVFVHAVEWYAKEVPEDEDEREQLYDEMLNPPPEDSYFSRSDIESMRKDFPKNFVEIDIDLDLDDDPECSVRDALCSNPIFC